MAGRRLDAEERALWRRVTADVRRLEREAKQPDETPPAPPPSPPPPSQKAKAKPRPQPAQAPDLRKPPPAAAPADTLDGGWDRRLKRGIISPDRSIDLHGHTLAGAHDALEAALDRAVAEEVRVLLVVTGRPPRPGAERRGLIRAAIGDWLAHSRHASRIAAVRNAHPRHGGAGALYLVLRRKREDRGSVR